MRCFIAIDFPREIMNELGKIQEELKKKKIFHGKLTEKENLHLTLKFLGEIDDGQVEEVRKKLREIKFFRFEAGLGEIGVFSPRFIRIVWVHILGNKLNELQKEIDFKLQNFFSVEERFMSHLTIARVKNIKDRKLFIEEIEKIKIPKLSFEINNFKLMRSELKPSGAEYTSIEEYKLE